ncbi:LexA family protein [Crenobacter cavernae]|uniref:Peptidase S24 n=1 Tax=Crenobacter cavernae TaxID=2290923 RepID=A0ABY0FDF0_9NEIS|nr:translesion error-prone DNA polymerase V autoproteolytic subunit [Crenobacter cavernae]RXZ42643.1 peptidase S24 [Crenobacter cavernae]
MSQGGKRDGAGRKPRFEGDKTVAVRIPERLRPVLDQWLEDYRQLLSVKSAEVSNFRVLSDQLSGLSLPLFASRVPAGFPSPADDLKEAGIDLNAFLVDHPQTTFLVNVRGDSMINAGIHDGDLLLVDRSIEPRPGKVVVAVIDGELTVKRLKRDGERVWLMPDNPAYPPIAVTEDASFFIWGVVTNVIHPMK